MSDLREFLTDEAIEEIGRRQERWFDRHILGLGREEYVKYRQDPERGEWVETEERVTL